MCVPVFVYIFICDVRGEVFVCVCVKDGFMSFYGIVSLMNLYVEIFGSSVHLLGISL